MRRAVLLTTAVALAVAGVVLAGAWLALRPGGPPLAAASFSHTALSPNTDGDDDVTHINYALRRAANVSIYFVDSQGRRFDFRADKPREAGEHAVDFSGVVDPFILPGDAEVTNGPDGAPWPGEITARVLPDGAYTWHVEARDDQAQTNTLSGPLTIAGADTTLPQIRMTISPPVFTPNQDGLSDRVTINVWLNKDIDPDGLRVTLIGPDGLELPIAEKPSDVPFGQTGMHEYDYDAGIDLDLDPPPDSAYTVRAVAQDRLGQQVLTEGELRILHGGLPRADILLGDVNWSASTIILGNTLHFTLTVNNYGTGPLRTSGPWSGWVYDSMATNANSLGEYEEAGAWRVGIMCQTCKSDYPWRWALGTPEALTVIPDEAGNPQYYLMPGQRVTVSGGVVLDQVIPSNNPQFFWAGLIHEFVNVAPINNRVDPWNVLIVEP